MMKVDLAETMDKFVESRGAAAMASKTIDKPKLTSRCGQPVKPCYLVDLTKSRNLKWASKLGFERIIAQNWNTLAALNRAEALLNTFVETDTLVLPGKKPMHVTTKLVTEALNLPNEGIIELEINYVVEGEIPKKGSMHQVKDVPDLDRTEQFQFYM